MNRRKYGFKNYGLYIGDRAKVERFGKDEEVRVLSFDSFDNNACIVVDKDGKQSKQVCEWLDRIPPTEYLDFYPVMGLKYSVLTEIVDCQPSLTTVDGADLYEYVARIIFNYKKGFGQDDDRLKHVFIYLHESPSALSHEMYQVFEDADSFQRAIDSYEKMMEERKKADAEKTTEKE